MKISRIYTSQTIIDNKLLTLQGNSANYVYSALRKKSNDLLYVFNGSGKVWQAQIIVSTKKHIEMMVGDSIESQLESPLTIDMGQCVSRGNRMDYAIQKMTELGVSIISPILSERCEIKISETASQQKLNHWNNIAISACEQSGRNTIPEISTITPLTEWVSCCQNTTRLVLQPSATAHLLNNISKPESISVLIGPEGGLSEKEIQQATNCNFIPIQIGTRILRTETAPIVILTLLQYLWGDLLS